MNTVDPGIKRNLFWFLNVENAPLMKCSDNGLRCRMQNADTGAIGLNADPSYAYKHLKCSLYLILLLFQSFDEKNFPFSKTEVISLNSSIPSLTDS
jgi:hypothetical protein